MNKDLPIIIMDTNGMSDKEFSEARQTVKEFTGGVSFGGSDIAKIFGVSPWESPMEFYEMKSGIKPEVSYERNAAAKAAGHVLEEAVATFTKVWFEENNPQLSVSILNDTNMYQCGKTDNSGELLYPFAVANLDRIININGHNGVFEAKTTTSRNRVTIAEWKAGIVPVYYELQIRHYMAVRNLQFAIIACMWGFNTTDMAVIKVNRDYRIENQLMKVEKDFADCILQHKEPDYMECDPTLIADYYTRKEGMVDESLPCVDFSVYSDEVEEAVAIDKELEKAKETVKNLEEKKQILFNEWYPTFGKATKGRCKLSDGSSCIIELSQSYKREHVIEDKLKNDNPLVYEKYCKESFDNTSFKKEEPLLYQKYKAPKELNPNGVNTFKVKRVHEKTTLSGKVEYFA